MRRIFDLAIEETSLADLLNDAAFEIEEIDVSCSKEGYTTALIRYCLTRYPTRKTPRWKKRIKRFVMQDGRNQDLDSILLRSDCRIIEEFDFKTEMGVIIVLHFEEKNN